ncbi:MAG: AMP-binding protein [Bacteroidales bacterium]|jgi:long-chain acyl-CoA synthetase|nr:AMP-binding protein [Bacteroidales bacterium]
MIYPTIKELYLNSIKSFAKRPVSSLFNGESLSYEQFDERVKQMVDIFRKAGLTKGDKVALLSSNMPNWSVCYFATVISGMVIVPILPDFSADAISGILEHSESKALFVSDKLYAKVPKSAVSRMNVVVRAVNLAVIAHKDWSLERELTVTADLTPGDLAAIIYTSGTTSSPKGVMLSHKALCTQLDFVLNTMEANPDDVFLSILPLSHTYECSLGMLYPFMRGASVVYLGVPPTATSLLPALKQVRPTFMLSVPLIVEKLYARQVLGKFTGNKLLKMIYKIRFVRRLLHRIAGAKLYSTFGGRIKFFGIGGAKLNGPTEKFLREARFPYSIGYGLTETAPLLAAAVHPDTCLQSTGHILDGIQMRLSNVNPETGVGGIEVKTPCIMNGYFKNPEADQEAFTPDGWFRTKDLGVLDKKGRLFIRGRLNNMIVGSNGENIYPEEIESVLNTHSLVTESVVIQEKDKLVALVYFQDLKQELRDHMNEVYADIMQFVNERVSKISRITKVYEQQEEFEKTPTLKIKRYLYTNFKNNKKRAAS